MKQILTLLVALVLAGCAGGAPRVVRPEMAAVVEAGQLQKGMTVDEVAESLGLGRWRPAYWEGQVNGYRVLRVANLQLRCMFTPDGYLVSWIQH